MERYDVLLVNPPLSSVYESYEHLGLGYIAAYLRKADIKVKILNLSRWRVSQAVKEVRKYTSRVIGVSIPFQEGARRAFSFIVALRKAGITCHISIGGVYPTFACDELTIMFPEVDSVVLGEGEETFLELAQRVVGGSDWRDTNGIGYRHEGYLIRNNPRPLIRDVDSLPFPARDTLSELPGQKNLATMVTSRGCYGRCSFCSVEPFYSAFGPKLRMRSSSSVLEEISLLYNQYSVRNISFNDAIFIGGKGKGFVRAGEIAEGIIKRNMDLRFSIECRANDVDTGLFALLKQAGLSKVFIGIESGSQAVLDRFCKDTTVEENLKAMEILSELDLVTAMGFITFDDRITFTELNENLLFIRKAREIFPQNRLNFNVLGKLLPLAGTEAERHMKETGKYRGNSLKFDYDFDDKRINMLYKTIKSGADFFWKVKRALGMTIDYEQEWMKR